jgi:cytochrome c oxidase subunit IV
MTHLTHPVAPIRTYIFVWLSLIVLTFTTVVVAEVQLGEWNVVVALTIAVIKASLVAWFFMHVRESTSMTKLFVVAGLFWMAILMGLTFSDYISRSWLPKSHWW